MNGHQGFIRVLIVGLFLALTFGSGPSPASAADFNKDGYADLAIGVSWEPVNSQPAAGAVNVLYGTAGGISAASNQLWTQNDLSPHFSWWGDYFGEELAAGDFDGDGAVDLAVGAPHRDVSAVADAGAVYVLYGSSPQGLVSTGHQYWHQDSPGVKGVAESPDQFGSALAVGDFDGDGYDDLAVGAPHEDIDTINQAGAVNVLYGTAAGLTASGNQLWREGYNDLGGEAEVGDWFGFTLAAGDFDKDGHDDLAISIPGEDVGTIGDAGRVVILYGTAGGLTATGSQSWTQGGRGLQDVAEEVDHFGRTLATGDFDGDGYADLAIGTPFEDVVLEVDAGMVNVLFGTPDGLTSEGNQVFTLEAYTAEDWFGYALAAGDFNGDGFDELAVGIPGEDLHSWFNIGAVEILHGGSGGLGHRLGPDEFWSQNVAGMEDGPEMGDRFGYALAAGDFDGDHYADLAVGIPREDIGTTVDAGAVGILYGSADGITVTGNQFWHQDSPSVAGVAQENDRFGSALAAIPVPPPPIPPPPPPQWEKILLPLVMTND